MLQFEDRVTIITGAARGIGLATTRLLVAAGARVVAADRDGDELAEAVATLDEARVQPITADLLTDTGPQSVVDAAIERWGELDIVVNNAGFTWDAPLHLLDDEQWDAMLAIHATVPFRLLRAAAPHLREPAKRERADGIERFRKVVNVTSTSGTMGNATQANYAAGKAAVIGLTKSLAKEWGPLRINVNAVAFGAIDTRLTSEQRADNVTRVGDRDVQLGVPDHLRGMIDMFTPLGRPGTVHEAAGPIAFLCSDLANYVTGQVLTVNGGLPLGMNS
jgi:3-oxoacyl-[acyl-carrier protein] reductase